VAIYPLLIVLMLFLQPLKVMATNWDAKIDNSNTPISDAEVQAALSQGLSEGFAKVFSGKVYGIHVLLDTHRLEEQKGSVVYVALGLSRRVQKVALEIPSGRWSDLLFLPDDMEIEARQIMVQQKLVATAGQFGRVMQQNRSVIEKAIASRPNAGNEWTEWPDYVLLPKVSEPGDPVPTKAPPSPPSDSSPAPP